MCVALLLGALIACGERDAPGSKPAAVFPAARLSSLTGGDALPPEAQRGTALVINFWATWCEPCRKEMPSLERLHQQADAAKLRVIGVSVDNDLNLAREFLLQQRLTFPHYTDSAQKLARDLLKIQAFPATFVVAADGSVKAQITGARDWSSAETLRLLEQALDTNLAAK
jgi:thiol-disulfide isomerase/thioredoxin